MARALARGRADTEPEEEVLGGLAQMLDAAQLQAYRAQRQQLRAADNGEVWVLEENWDAVQVFQRCSWKTEGGARIVYCGIEAQEIRAVVEAFPDVSYTVQLLDDVRQMASVVGRIWNEKRS